MAADGHRPGIVLIAAGAGQPAIDQTVQTIEAAGYRIWRQVIVQPRLRSVAAEVRAGMRDGRATVVVLGDQSHADIHQAVALASDRLLDSADAPNARPVDAVPAGSSYLVQTGGPAIIFLDGAGIADFTDLSARIA